MADIYYIDPGGGDDATAVVNDSDLPWKTWSAAIAIGGGTFDNEFYQLAGTTALEQIGGIYTRLIFGKYGAGALPIIDGEGLVNSAIAASVETQASDPLTIHDLHIIGFGVSGIETTTNGQQSTDIQGVHITLTVTSTGNGITLAGSNCIVKNSTIDYAGNNGIYGAGKNIAFENALIEGNTVSNIQLNDGITLHGGPFDGDHNVIRSNEIF